MFKNILFLMMLLVSSIWAVDLTLDNVDTEAGTLDIVMNNDDLVAGFQLDLTGITITGASGGSAEEAGFAVSYSATTILGFSFSGATIPAGEGTLVSVSFTGFDSEICIDSPVISDTSGNAMDVSIGDCYTGGGSGGSSAISFGSVEDGSLEIVLDNN